LLIDQCFHDDVILDDFIELMDERLAYAPN